MSLPYNEGTALVPRTWLPRGEAVPATTVGQGAYPGERILVSGAGTAAANGVYTKISDTTFIKDTPHHVYLEAGEVWIIGAYGAAAADLYASVSYTEGQAPWEVTYTNSSYSGALPAPTVTLLP